MKCDFIRYSPTETSTRNTPNSQIKINIPREVSGIPFLNSYIDLNFEVIKKSENFIYGSGKVIRLVFLGPSALFSNFFYLQANTQKMLVVVT